MNNKNNLNILAEEVIDVAVIGAGHAGCEAALATARIGYKTTLFAINLDSIAMMPCNPNIGGSSKGHLVREIDALGGEMAKIIDKSYIQTRMLNTSKGPAVYSLRAQADKNKYHTEMKRILENTENLDIVQTEITEIVVENKSVIGVMREDGIFYRCNAVILCTGTYLKSKCLYGDVVIESGPNGLKQSTSLSDCLKNLGVEMYRFKTGTPARIDRRSVDFSKMSIQNGDEDIIPFSFENTPDKIRKQQEPCYLTYTNAETHKIINENLSRSAMYGGMIEGTGPRYCPSIEDKIVRFADKERHQVFVEPEGLDTNEMYVQGMSTSLPADVQIKMYRSIEGLENCKIMRIGYAIEYDCINSKQLKLSLEFKNIGGLFSAGQFNGTSGYEEAAAQGILAGINATKYLKNEEALILDRSDAYIGVLIDDIITKGTSEPYRMMTSRAEYRLLLRQDNADLRLTEIGYKCGLIKEDRYNKFLAKKNCIEDNLKRIKKISIAPTQEVNSILEKYDSTLLKTGIKFTDLIRRTELSYEKLLELDKGNIEKYSQETNIEMTYDIIEQINIQIKYEGYIDKQLRQVNQFKKYEKKLIPKDIDYKEVLSLSLEGRQNLEKIRPESVGHASRISGISPADINMLLVYLNN